MLYTLNWHSDVCQLFVDKTGKKKNSKINALMALLYDNKWNLGCMQPQTLPSWVVQITDLLRKCREKNLVLCFVTINSYLKYILKS